MGLTFDWRERRLVQVRARKIGVVVIRQKVRTTQENSPFEKTELGSKLARAARRATLMVDP